jgi:hypothetical protein
VIGHKAWYFGRGAVCPVLVVGTEGKRLVVWKLINGVILERVVEARDIFTLSYWINNLEIT